MDDKYLEFERSFIPRFDLNGHNARGIMRETMYHKPKDISLQEANALLVTFAFTRHPFNRLVSAYDDKLKDNKRNLDDLGMISFRNVDPRKTNDYPSPKEFVTYLLQQVEIKGPFAFNAHWRPQFSLCPYCSIDFDYVGDINDMNYHVDFLSDILGFKVYLEHNFTLTISA